jgi:F-type H+-transporting ATPase subunit epsilon
MMSETGADTFHFELVSPEEKLISAPAKMVTVPGEEGEFGVLPLHAATISSVRPGVIEIISDDEDPKRIFVAGGFADVTDKSCTVLAEEAIDVKELSNDALEQEIANLNEDITMASDETEKARIMQKLKLAKAKLTALTGKFVA